MYWVCAIAGKLLMALLTGLGDRSATVRKAYARAIGHLVKVRAGREVLVLPWNKTNTYLFNFLSVIMYFFVWFDFLVLCVKVSATGRSLRISLLHTHFCILAFLGFIHLSSSIWLLV